MDALSGNDCASMQTFVSDSSGADEILDPEFDKLSSCVEIEESRRGKRSLFSLKSLGMPCFRPKLDSESFINLKCLTLQVTNRPFLSKSLSQTLSLNRQKAFLTAWISAVSAGNNERKLAFLIKRFLQINDEFQWDRIETFVKSISLKDVAIMGEILKKCLSDISLKWILSKLNAIIAAEDSTAFFTAFHPHESGFSNIQNDFTDAFAITAKSYIDLNCPKEFSASLLKLLIVLKNANCSCISLRFQSPLKMDGLLSKCIEYLVIEESIDQFKKEFGIIEVNLSYNDLMIDGNVCTSIEGLSIEERSSSSAIAAKSNLLYLLQLSLTDYSLDEFFDDQFKINDCDVVKDFIIEDLLHQESEYPTLWKLYLYSFIKDNQIFSDCKVHGKISSDSQLVIIDAEKVDSDILSWIQCRLVSYISDVGAEPIDDTSKSLLQITSANNKIVSLWASVLDSMSKENGTIPFALVHSFIQELLCIHQMKNVTFLTLTLVEDFQIPTNLIPLLSIPIEKYHFLSFLIYLFTKLPKFNVQIVDDSESLQKCLIDQAEKAILNDPLTEDSELNETDIDENLQNSISFNNESFSNNNYLQIDCPKSADVHSTLKYNDSIPNLNSSNTDYDSHDSLILHCQMNHKICSTLNTYQPAFESDANQSSVTNDCMPESANDRSAAFGQNKLLTSDTLEKVCNFNQMEFQSIAVPLDAKEYLSTPSHVVINDESLIGLNESFDLQNNDESVKIDKLALEDDARDFSSSEQRYADIDLFTIGGERSRSGDFLASISPTSLADGDLKAISDPLTKLSIISDRIGRGEHLKKSFPLLNCLLKENNNFQFEMSFCNVVLELIPSVLDCNLVREMVLTLHLIPHEKTTSRVQYAKAAWACRDWADILYELLTLSSLNQSTSKDQTHQDSRSDSDACKDLSSTASSFKKFKSNAYSSNADFIKVDSIDLVEGIISKLLAHCKARFTKTGAIRLRSGNLMGTAVLYRLSHTILSSSK